jgi:PAS domain S-box-containing protein
MNTPEKAILLIDDDRDLHQLTGRALSSAGLKLISAYNGAQGLAKIRQCRPALVLLDHMMPVKDGCSVFRELMEEPRYEEFRDIPVIMLTAAVKEREEIEGLLDMGLAAFLNKPFGHRELVSIVKNHLILHGVKLRKARLAATLRQARDFLESLVESAPIAIIATDAAGKISYFSRGAEELLGYDTAEMDQHDFRDLIPREHDILRRVLDNTDEVPERQTFEVTLLSRSGEAVAVSLTVTPLCAADGTVCGLLWLGIDLSEIRRLQEALIEQERLAAITEAVATVNHEINNPLTPILGNVQLLLEGGKPLDPEVERRLRVIETNAWKIHEIVIKLTQITRPVRTLYYGEANMLDLDGATTTVE